MDAVNKTLPPKLPIAAQASTVPGKAEDVRGRFADVLAQTLLTPVIQKMQKSPFKTKYMDGGRGEEVFAGQLAIELAGRIGHALRGGLSRAMGASLSDAAQKAQAVHDNGDRK